MYLKQAVAIAVGINKAVTSAHESALRILLGIELHQGIPVGRHIGHKGNIVLLVHGMVDMDEKLMFNHVIIDLMF